MEVHAIDTLSGREEPLEIDADATVSAMKRRCGEAFGFGEDVELSVDGQRVACDGAERVSNVAAFSGGCRVAVVRGVEQFVAQLRSGAVKMDDIPAWARQRRECALAVLARALERREGVLAAWGSNILPHWVHPSLHDDKEVMLQFVKYNPTAFVRASAALRSDADVVIAALKQDASLWTHVEDKGLLQEQRSVAVVAVPHCANSAVWLSDKAFVPEALGYSAEWTDVSKALQQDKDVVLEALNQGKMNFDSEAVQEHKEVVMESLDYLKDFSQLSATLQEDKEVVMEAFDRIPVPFGDLSEALRGDKEVVMKALDYNVPQDFHQMSATLPEDKELVMKALGSNALEDIHQVSAMLQEDTELIMKAFDTRKVKFGDLSEALRGDKEVVMKAFDTRKVKFGDLSEALRRDKEVVMKALDTRKVKFGDLGEALRGDKEVVMEAFDRILVPFGDLSESLRGDKEVVMKALDYEALEDFHQVSATLQEDKEVVMQALRIRKVQFGALSEALRGDKAFVMQAIAANLATYVSVTGPLRQDKDVAMRVVARSPALFATLSPALRDDLTVALAAIRAKPLNFVYAGDTVRADKQAALAAFSQGEKCYHPPVLLPFASAELQADREVVLAAVRMNAQNADYASPALQDLVPSGP